MMMMDTHTAGNCEGLGSAQVELEESAKRKNLSQRCVSVCYGNFITELRNIDWDCTEWWSISLLGNKLLSFYIGHSSINLS